MSNVLSEEKKQQVIALGRLGWSLRRIERSTGVRRETAAGYLKAAGIVFRAPGASAQQLPAKPATEVITDSMAAKPGHEVDAKPVSAKPAIEVTTDCGAGLTSAVASEPRRPDRSRSASACAPHQEAIELGLSRGRNAMAIWQDLVDTCSFTGGYQSVRRFIRKLHPNASPEACAVIETAPGEEGPGRLWKRPHGA